MIQTVGKLIYDPYRKDLRKTHKARTLIAELPRDQLDLYYQWFLTKKYGTWMTLQRPMYGLHVTIVKGDEKVPQDRLHLWKKYQGQPIELMYDPTKLQCNWKFWSLEVKSDKILEIREELGLKGLYRPHITIGRAYDWMPNA